MEYGFTTAAYVVAAVLFAGSLGLPAEERVRDLGIYDWIAVGALNVEFGLRIDPLSLTQLDHIPLPDGPAVWRVVTVNRASLP